MAIMLNAIRQAWNWIGIEPTEIVAVNSFGNVIFRIIDGSLWRICPEELSCEQIARNSDEFAILLNDEDFQIDWNMSALVRLAEEKLGPVPEGKCYCLKLPAVLGGKYEVENLGTVPLNELILFAGDLAQKTKDVPDGSHVVIKIDP